MNFITQARACVRRWPAILNLSVPGALRDLARRAALDVG